jgi:hypothetical protein
VEVEVAVAVAVVLARGEAVLSTARTSTAVATTLARSLSGRDSSPPPDEAPSVGLDVFRLLGSELSGKPRFPNLASLSGEVLAATGGGAELTGAYEGMAAAAVILSCLLAFSTLFLVLFGYSVLHLTDSTPPVPWWTLLFPVGFDVLGLVIFEVNYAGQNVQRKALEDWLCTTAQFRVTFQHG